MNVRFISDCSVLYAQKVERYQFKLRYAISCCCGSCLCLIRVNLGRIPVNERNDDVLDIDVLMKLSTGTQERVQGLEVKLIWEHLPKQRHLLFPHTAV